jgi:hypothetical protein
VNGSKPYSPRASAARQIRGHSRRAVLRSLSLLPSPFGRVNHSLRGDQSRPLGFPLRDARYFLSLGGEDQGEGKRRELPFRVSDHSRTSRKGRVLRRSRRFPKMTMRRTLHALLLITATLHVMVGVKAQPEPVPGNPPAAPAPGTAPAQPSGRDVAFRQHSAGHTDGPNWPIFLKFADRYIGTKGTSR